MTLRQEVDHLLEPIWKRLRTQVLRAVLQAVDDTQAVQVVKVTGLSDDVFNIEHMVPYGFFSVPPVGSEGLLLKVGNASNRVAAFLNQRSSRPSGQVAGASGLHDGDGIKVLLLPGGGLLLGTTSATKGVARDGDAVRVTIPAGTFMTGVVPTVVGGVVTAVVPVLNPAPVVVTGQIVGPCSASVKAAD